MRPRWFSWLLRSLKDRRRRISHFLLLLYGSSNKGSCQEPLLLGLKIALATSFKWQMICMECQALFPQKNKIFKNVSATILNGALSVNINALNQLREEVSKC